MLPNATGPAERLRILTGRAGAACSLCRAFLDRCIQVHSSREWAAPGRQAGRAVGAVKGPGGCQVSRCGRQREAGRCGAVMVHARGTPGHAAFMGQSSSGPDMQPSWGTPGHAPFKGLSQMQGAGLTATDAWGASDSQHHQARRVTRCFFRWLRSAQFGSRCFRCETVAGRRW